MMYDDEWEPEPKKDADVSDGCIGFALLFAAFAAFFWGVLIGSIVR